MRMLGRSIGSLLLATGLLTVFAGGASAEEARYVYLGRYATFADCIVDKINAQKYVDGEDEIICQDSYDGSYTEMFAVYY